ncbi:MAG TPA: protein kinase family protein [Candidatus Saccharimonadales bacterium]|nr:protein kinase family protein [Candidatus Saccharimonadales bacterium]
MKLNRVGGGGQSDVYLARSPERSLMREEYFGELQKLANGARHREYAEYIFESARPDLPHEVGALKVFKLRENSGKPIDRLKKEIAILKEGRPNLPKLLDSNAVELWMVTEYFPDHTLAEHPNKFFGRPLEALTAFRGLVETIARLHRDNVVHRDIKRSNIFVSTEGKLIPGDFGLVFTGHTEDRVTLPDERVGPWEHLPWWANDGERLENPTPAIDVFLLGGLLWTMITGKNLHHGDKFKHTSRDLELKFKGERWMRLINLVLSQCLGEEEHKCLKDAGELLMVVDEVLDTMNHGAPITDENNMIVIPCRFCNRGFYQVLENHEGKLRNNLNVSNQHGVHVQVISFDILQCNACHNVQYFAPSQPFEAMSKDYKSRVNPQRGATARAW